MLKKQNKMHYPIFLLHFLTIFLFLFFFFFFASWQSKVVIKFLATECKTWLILTNCICGKSTGFTRLCKWVSVTYLFCLALYNFFQKREKKSLNNHGILLNTVPGQLLTIKILSIPMNVQTNDHWQKEDTRRLETKEYKSDGIL